MNRDTYSRDHYNRERAVLAAVGTVDRLYQHCIVAACDHFDVQFDDALALVSYRVELAEADVLRDRQAREA